MAKIQSAGDNQGVEAAARQGDGFDNLTFKWSGSKNTSGMGPGGSTATWDDTRLEVDAGAPVSLDGDGNISFELGYEWLITAHAALPFLSSVSGHVSYTLLDPGQPPTHEHFELPYVGIPGSVWRSSMDYSSVIRNFGGFQMIVDNNTSGSVDIVVFRPHFLISGVLLRSLDAIEIQTWP